MFRKNVLPLEVSGTIESHYRRCAKKMGMEDEVEPNRFRLCPWWNIPLIVSHLPLNFKVVATTALH